MNPVYYSKQDQLVDNIFHRKTNGFYVDVGAHDGGLTCLTNTKFFEKFRDWRGLNIDANPNIVQTLFKHRPKSMVTCSAVSSEDNPNVLFCLYPKPLEQFSAISHLNSPNIIRMKQLLTYYQAPRPTYINVISRRMSTIFKELDISKVDYLTISVCGAEEEVIKSIDFDAVKITVISFLSSSVEQNDEIQRYLNEHGFARGMPKTGYTTLINNENLILEEEKEVSEEEKEVSEEEKEVSEEEKEKGKKKVGTSDDESG